MDKISRLSSEIKECIESIIDKTDSLICFLKSSDSTFILTPDSNLGLDYISRAMKDLWYEEHTDGRLTNTYTAVVLCDQESINLVNEVNDLKTKFISFKQQSDNIDRKIFKVLIEDLLVSKDFRKRLALLGYSRLNINHLRRKIPVFQDCEIKAIRYSHYSKGRSLKKVEPKQALKMLLDLNKSQPEHIKTQISLLGNHPHSVELYVVRNIAPIVKANIFFNVGMKTVCPPLPIFIESSCFNSADVNFFPRVGIKRKVRSDRVIEDTPFLPSINVHRKVY